MAGAKLETTKWPGIYKRPGKSPGSKVRWVYSWTDAAGKARRGTADTLDEAKARKAAEEERSRRGEHADAGPSGRLTVAAYAFDLFGADLDREAGAPRARGRYEGRRGAIRDNTRDEYRRDLEVYWLPALGRRPLAKVTTPELARVVGELAARDGADYRADGTLRRIFAPLGALFAQAVEEGVIPANPARDVRLPSGRDRLRKFDPDAGEDSDDPTPGAARALTREQLADFLLVVDVRWRVFFELLAATGLRVSEAIALRWRDLALDGERPVVRVRRAYVRGTFGPPKSRHGRRDVPLSFELVRALRERRQAAEWHQDDDLVFPSLAGTPMHPENLRRRVLEPATQEAGVAWAGFHAFRHLCASLLIDQGRSIVQVSRWLGHHSPSFTLAVYAHLMDEGVGAAIDLGGVTSGSRSVLRDASFPLDRGSVNR